MSHYQTIKALGNPVVLHSNLTKFLGSITASAFLSHMMYWSDKTTNPLGVYKTCEQITDETGLSKKEQMTARKILRELGLIVETHKRLEHRLYYRFDSHAFDEWFGQQLAKSSQATKGDVATCQKDLPPSANTDHPELTKQTAPKCQNSTSLYTKITTKNTTKITTKSEGKKRTAIADTPTPPKRKKSPTEFPSELQPTPNQIKKCQTLGFDVNALFEHFSSHHQAKGSRFVDWSRAFDTWIINQQKFAKPKLDKLAVNHKHGQSEVFIPKVSEQEYDQHGNPIFKAVW